MGGGEGEERREEGEQRKGEKEKGEKKCKRRLKDGGKD